MPTLLRAALALALVTLPAAAEEPSDAGRADAATGDAREDSMFGEEEPAPAPAPAEAGPAFDSSDPATPNPLETPTDDDESARLTADDPNRLTSFVEATNDKLQIGGRAILQGIYGYRETPELAPAELPLTAPSLVDVYLDSRPNDRLRFYARGRLTYDLASPVRDRAAPSARNPFGSSANPLAQVDQLWLKFDVARTVFVTIGKQRIRWGAGRFWNPTDFLNQARLDPVAVADFRLGANLVKLHVPVPSLGWNFYGILDLQAVPTQANPAGQLTPARVGGALRGELLLGDAEVALTAYGRPTEEVLVDGTIRNDVTVRLGADLSMPLGPVDLRLESAFVRDPTLAYFEGTLDLDPVNLSIPTRRDRSKEFVPQVVAALEYSHPYSDEDSLTVSAEYFFNDAGYDDASLYPFFLGSAALVPTLDGPDPTFRDALGPKRVADIRAASSSFTPLYLGRHYVNLGVAVPNPGPLNDTMFGASVIGNLSDGSWLAQATVFQTVLTNLSVAVFARYNFGRAGEFLTRFDVPSPSGTVAIPPTRFQLFASLIVSI